MREKNIILGLIIVIDGTCENFKNDGKLLFGVSIGFIEKHMGNYLFSMGMDKIIEGYYKNVEKVCMCSRISIIKSILLKELKMYRALN